MHQVSWTYTLPDESASNVWTLDNVPEGAKGSFITHVQDSQGNLHTPDHQELDGAGNLLLYFGATDLAGTAYGNYYLDHGYEDDGDNGVVVETDEQTIRSAGKVVNITVNQYDHGGLESQS